MRKPLPTRRRARGMPFMLLAALLLLARLTAPAAALQADPADAIERIALQTLCHGAAPDDNAPTPIPAHHDCLLCPACHLLSHAAIPAPSGPALQPPARPLIARAAAPPPATGPPPRPRPVAQPTGPPTLSV